LTERTQQANEFRQAVLSLRLADEKLRQSTDLQIRVSNNLVEYVKNEKLSVSEIKRHEDEIKTVAQTASSDCTAAKQAWYTYRISLENVARHFLWPRPPDWRESVSSRDTRCEELLSFSQGQSLPDATKLVSDINYRRTFIEAQDPYFSKFDDQMEVLRQGLIKRDADNERLLAVLEDQNSTVAKRVWGCFRLLFWHPSYKGSLNE